MFNEPFVLLKINNQALESAFTAASPGEVFKVFGSQRLRETQPTQSHVCSLLFCGLMITDGHAESKQKSLSKQELDLLP